MQYSMSQLESWDNFFYYQSNDFDLECQHELMLLLLQPPRSLFYDNQESGGIAGYENYPNDIGLQVYGRYAIAQAIAWKNRQVTDGSDDTIDRRLAISQNFISFDQSGGNLDVNVVYIPYKSYNTFKTISAIFGV